MNVEKIRSDFQIFEQSCGCFIYFDNAATTQKPRQVINKISDFYAYHTANIFRSLYVRAERTTSLYEQARACIASFIGSKPQELVFTSGTTEGINFIAATWGQKFITAGDEIVVTQMEHHANFLPWQQLAEKVGALLKVVPITAEGLLDMDAYQGLLSKKTKLVAVTHVSNVLGTTNDVKKIITLAHEVNAKVLVDAAQSAPHKKLDVHEMGADFLVFSGHKMLGPTGIGCLFIKEELQDAIPPYQVGGGMVTEVCREKSLWAPPPRKFEAGTPPIAQAIGLAAAINYLENYVPFKDLHQHESRLVTRAIEGLQTIGGINIVGPVNQLKQEGHLVSFFVDGVHAHDVAAFLDTDEIAVAVRAGQQCAQPLHALLGLPATVRVSFYCYNTLEEVDCFIDRMRKLKSLET